MEFDAIARAKYDRMNLDEAKVRPCHVPDPLRRSDGAQVADAIGWENELRPHWLRLFAREMYGEVPPRPEAMNFRVLSEKPDAFDGLATRREVMIECVNRGRKLELLLLLYLPNRAPGPVPAFFGLNFRSNASCTAESDVMLSPFPAWKLAGGMFVDERATAENRGYQQSRWNFPEVLARGYATGTVHYFDAFPDCPEGFGHSVYRLFHEPAELAGDCHDFGAIGAWSWAISRALDYYESEPRIDRRRMIVHGHSRLGKTALWAGANDLRAALTVSNCSGCGGAALSRRNFGESLEWLLHWRPYWFHRNWQKYIDREAELPFDQHILLALLAPRLVYVDSATLDDYADPRGEFTSAKLAEPVWRLFGSPGLGEAEMPAADTPAGTDIGYHIRTGKHDMTLFDWNAIIDFADRHWRHGVV